MERSCVGRATGSITAATLAVMLTMSPSPAHGACIASLKVGSRLLTDAGASFPSLAEAKARRPVAARIPPCTDVAPFPPVPPSPPPPATPTTAFKLPGVATTLAVAWRPGPGAEVRVLTWRRKCTAFAGRSAPHAYRARLLSCLRWHTAHPA